MDDSPLPRWSERARRAARDHHAMTPVGSTKLAFITSATPLVILGIGAVSLLFREPQETSQDSDSGYVVLLTLFGLCVLATAVALWPIASGPRSPARPWAIATFIWAGALLVCLFFLLAYAGTTSVPFIPTLVFYPGLLLLMFGSLIAWRRSKSTHAQP